jgi:sulfite reductase (ferredoxin)
VGRISGTLLVALADVMEEFEIEGARLTPYQKIVLIGARPEIVDRLLDRLDEIGLPGRPSNWRQNTMACTGIEFCKLAIVDTKDRARDLIAELEQRLPALDTPITINVNGCPNACARTQVADIGLKGQLVMHEGEQVEGFQVHLGGATGLNANFGRKLRAHKVTSAGLGDYVTSVVSNYLADRKEQESFADWVQRADEELLRGDRTLEGAAS